MLCARHCVHIADALALSCTFYGIEPSQTISIGLSQAHFPPCGSKQWRKHREPWLRAVRIYSLASYFPGLLPSYFQHIRDFVIIALYKSTFTIPSPFHTEWKSLESFIPVVWFHQPFTTHLLLPTMLARKVINFIVSVHPFIFNFWTAYCLQCIDAVGWAAGRASGL